MWVDDKIIYICLSLYVHSPTRPLAGRVRVTESSCGLVRVSACVLAKPLVGGGGWGGGSPPPLYSVYTYLMNNII